MKHILVAIFICLKFTVNAEDSGMHIEHDASWQQILDKAKKENKFILLDAYASWCGPCKWMAKKVFPKPEVGAAVNPYYISAKIDMEKGEGLELAKKYNVRNYPTYLFFDANGELVHRSLGSMPASDFITLCTNSLNPEFQFVTLRKKYLSGQRDTVFLKRFIKEALYNQDSLYKASMIEYLTSVKIIDDVDVEFVFYVTTNLHDTTFSLIQNNIEKFNKIIGKDKVDALTEELVWNEAKVAGKKGSDKESFKKVIQQYLPGKTDLLCAEYEISLLKRAADWKAYLPKALVFADIYCKNDYERLNSVAGTIWENYKDKASLEKALKFALRSVELNSNFDNNDTVARLYAKLNNKSIAKKYAQTSLELAKKEGVETFDIEQFIKTLK